MNKPDGGQAFPVSPAAYNGGIEGYEGMTLRDYFAAHAPDVAEFFNPVMPTLYPKAQDQNSKSYDSNLEEMRAWEKEYFRQKCIQWPYYWADTQIAERGMVSE